MFDNMHPQNGQRARRLHAQLSDLFLKGKINSPTYNHYVLQFGVRMSTNGDRAASLDALEAVARFASFVPEHTFTGAEEPISEKRIQEVKEEFWRQTGIDRQGRGPQAAATRMSHGAAATAHDDIPSDPVTREFWETIGLIRKR